MVRLLKKMPIFRGSEVVGERVAIAFCSSVTAGGRDDLLFRMTINEESHPILIVSVCGLGVIQYAGEKYSYQSVLWHWVAENCS